MIVKFANLLITYTGESSRTVFMATVVITVVVVYGHDLVTLPSAIIVTTR